MACVPKDTAGGFEPRPDAYESQFETTDEAKDNFAESQADVDRLIDIVSNTMSESSNIPEGAPVTPSADALRAARAAHADLGDAVNRGMAKEQARAAEWVSQVEMNAANSVGRIGWFMNLASSISHTLLRGNEAIMDRWAVLTMPMEGRSLSANSLSAALHGRKDKLLGSLSVLNERYMKPFLESIRPAADRLGFADVSQFAHVVGNWATARHMPERNKYLRETVYPRLIEKARNDGDEAAAIDLEAKLQELIDGQFEIGENDETGRRWFSGGLTDAEAQQVQESFLSQYRIPREEMDRYADNLMNVYRNIQLYRAEEGFIDQNAFEKLPKDFVYFVPTRAMSAFKKGNQFEDAAIYNPGNLRAMEGTYGDVANAYFTIDHFMRRTAQEYANRDLGQILIALRRHAKDNNVEGRYGLLVESYDPDAMSRSERLHDMLEGKYGFVMSATMPEVQADGSVKNHRYAISFDPFYVDQANNISGQELNRAMQDEVRNDIVLGQFGKWNNNLASLNTYYNIAFSPVNMTRDLGERASAMIGQSYRMENGNLVDGSSLVRSYIAAVPQVMKFLANVMRGRVDLDASPIGRYYKEYVQDGIKQQFNPNKERTNTEMQRVQGAEDFNRGVTEFNQMMKDKRFAGLRNAMVGTAGPILQKASRWLANWNDYFNNVASLSQYYALRNSGVARESAREGTISIMNLRENGTATAALRAVYPFVKPTMQGAASILRTMGLAPNAAGKFQPNLKGTAFLASQVAAFAVLKPMLAASFGEDELDAMPITDLARFIPIKLDDEGNIIKLNLPFGPTPIAATLYHTLDRAARGKIDGMDAMGEILASIVRNVQPADLPLFAASTDPALYLMQLVTPSTFMPILRVASNTSAYGRELTYADKDSLVPMSEQGSIRTPSGWHTFARMASPIVDLAPEQWRTLIEGYANGPIRLLTGLINQESAINMGIDKTTQGVLGPFLTALGMTAWYKHLPDATSQRFYQEYAAVRDRIRKYNVPLKDGVERRGEEREAFFRQQMSDKGVPQEDIDKYFDFYHADQDIRKLGTQLKKAVLETGVLDDPSNDAWRELYDAYYEARKERQAVGLGL